MQASSTASTASSSKTPQLFACTLCPATFGRLEHLQRHTASSHSVDRPFPCTFCSQSFARRDVLVRHLKSCKVRCQAGEPISVTPARRRGRKKKSCDACVRLKRPCSGTQPCTACVHRRQLCSFTSPDTQTAEPAEKPAGEQWLDHAVPQQPQQYKTEESVPVMNTSFVPQEQPRLPSDPDSINSIQPFAAPQPGLFDPFSPPCGDNMGANGHLMNSSTLDNIQTPWTSMLDRLRFISNFTSTQGMASSFDCGTPEQRMETMAALLSATSTTHDYANADSYLLPKTHAIVCAIKRGMDAQTPRRTTQITWTHALEQACSSFFAPVNLRRFIHYYWAIWHPNCPILHKPTFREELAPNLLLAAMALIGACISPMEGDQESAVLWLDPLEEAVFSMAEFCDEPLRGDSSIQPDRDLRVRVDALKSAYCMILLQTWEGKEEARRRARRSRYTDIIGVTRSLCAKAVTHGDLQSYLTSGLQSKTWMDFVLKEELIRVLTYVVLLDCAYVIFNNTPARMALRECRIGLACPEACFQAEDANSWQDTIRLWAASEIGRRQITIAQSISLIYTERFSQEDWNLLRQMSTLNMFTLVHPLHVQLFHVRCHPIPGSQTPLIRRALDNWRLIWMERAGLFGLDELSFTTPQNQWKSIGFTKHATEYWCLADLILSSAETAHFTDFEQNGGTNESLVAQLLDRYDESDMSQVHDLVNLFGAMNL